MGLRDRIRAGIKRVLQGTPEPKQPVQPEPPTQARSPAPAEPPVQASQPEPAAPAKPPAQAQTAPHAEPAPAKPPAQAQTAPHAEPPAPAEPLLPIQPAPAEAPPKTIHRATTDSPIREAHLRPSFSTTISAFQVHIVNPELGIDLQFPCEPGEYVVEAADRAGYELPASCRNGGCLTCTGKLLEGEAEIMEDQYVLEEEHLKAGFRLLCCATPRSHIKVLSHQQESI
jgi:ferredoxin